MSVDTKRKRLARVAAVFAIVGGASVALGCFGGSNDEGAPDAHTTYDLTRPGTTVVLRVLAPVLY